MKLVENIFASVQVTCRLLLYIRPNVSHLHAEKKVPWQFDMLDFFTFHRAEICVDVNLYMWLTLHLSRSSKGI